MATITPTYPDTGGQPGLKRVQWVFSGADTGVAVQADEWPDKTVSVVGTWNGATVVIEQSEDNVTFLTSVDPQGNNISKTADAMETILDNTKYIRPRVSAGTPTSLTITITAMQ